MKKHISLAVLGAYFFFCVVLLLPLFRNFSTTVTDDYDGLLIAWTIHWVEYSATHAPQHLYNAPIFAPYQYTLTYTDPFVTAAMIGMPVYVLFHQPILVANVNLVLALVLTAFFFFLLSFELTKNWRLSFLLGGLAGFSVTHLHYLGQLHTLMLEFIPLGLWAWLKFSQSEKLHYRYFVLACVCFSAQTLNSPFSGYLFLMCGGLFLFDPRSQQIIRQHWWRLLSYFVLFCALPLGFFYYPYFVSANFYHSYRTIRDAAHFALSLNELLSLNRVSVIFALLLALIFFHKKHSWSPLAKGALLVFTASTILALGPALKWQGLTVKAPFAIPLPYALAYYVLPGFKAFRTPSRWLASAYIGLLMLFALIWKEKKVSYIWVLLCFVIMYLEAQQFMTFYHLPTPQDYPPVYQWLATHTSPTTTVAHLPPYTYDQPDAKRETYRMIFSINDSHIYSVYNGYSGFATQERMDEMDYLHDQPFTAQSEIILEKNHVDLVVIHLDELSASNASIAAQFKNSAMYSDPQTVVIPTKSLLSN